MSEPEPIAILHAWIKEIAREAFQECARDYAARSGSTDDASAKLRAQLALIKS